MFSVIQIFSLLKKKNEIAKIYTLKIIPLKWTQLIYLFLEFEDDSDNDNPNREDDVDKKLNDAIAKMEVRL